MAPEVDWSQFTTEPPPEAAPATPEDVDWSQFTEQPPDFGNVQSGSASAPLAQFQPSAWERMKASARQIGDQMATGAQAILQGGDYEVAPDDPRQLVSDPAVFGRTVAGDVTGMAQIAYDYGTPAGITTKLAETFGAPKVDPVRALLGKQAEAVEFNPETMRAQSPRGEAFASGVGHLLAGYIPESRLAKSLDDLLSPEARAVMNGSREGRELALTGDLGPEAQGSATADEILSRAVAEQPRPPAVPERPAAEVVPAEAAESVPGETGIAVRGTESAPAPAPEAVLAPRAEIPEAAPAPSGEAVEVSELSPEDVPEEFRARLQQQETPTAEATPEELAAFERQRQPTEPDATFENNASGESAASLEAQHRIADEKAAGQTRALIEPNGEVRPLVGVDAVDTVARPGQVIVQRGIGKDDWTILSHGDNLPPRLAQARVNATRNRLDELHAAQNEDRGPLPGPIDTSTIPFESAQALPPRLRSAHARTVRSDTRPPAVAREVPQGSRTDRSGDVQFPPPEGRSIPERLRAGGEGAPPARPIPAEGGGRVEPPSGRLPPSGEGGNPRLPSRPGEIAKVRGIWDSAVDVLKRSPEFRPLGEAVERHYDTMQRREGEASKFLREAFADNRTLSDPLKRQRKADRDAFAEYQAAIQNGRTPPKLTPGAQKMVDAWRGFAEHSGAENQRVGVKVFDPKLGKSRPIGRAKDFFPRTLKREYADAMRDPGKHKAAWERMVGILKDKGVIDTDEEAGRFLRDHFDDTSSNDYFAGIEKARGEPLPEELYDYSTDAAVRYAKRWAERLSQIEAFGQKLGEYDKDLFDVFKGKTTDEGTKAYIDAVGKLVYNVRSKDDFARFAQTLNTIATGLQLGNPATSALNLIDGLFQNASTFGVSNMIRGLADLRQLSKAIKDAHDIGILRGDFLDLLHDNEVMDVPRIASNATKVALSVGGYNLTESINRMHAYMTAKAWLREALKAKPGSGAARQYQRLLDKSGADVAKLKGGDAAETEKFYRKAVNEAQFSYNLTQTPVYANTPVGKFLLKYQKFGLQMSRFYWQNVMEPSITSPNARTLGNLLRYWIAAAVGGGLILSLRQNLFGYQSSAPETSEIEKAWQDKKYRDAITLAAHRAWVGNLAIGGLGFFSNYVQLGQDIADRQRVKNPLNPPGIAPIVGLANLGLTLYDQKGTGVKRALEEFATANVSAYRTGKRLLGFATGSDSADRDYAFAKKMTRRYADDRNIEAKRRAPSDIIATPMTPVNKDIHDALIVGDAKEAKRLARAYLESLDTAAEQKAAWNSMKASARARQPTLVSVSPSAAERRDFLAWAREHLEKPEYERITRLDDTYRNAAIEAGLLREENADKLDRAAGKREQERQEKLSPDALDKMLGDTE